MGPPSTGDSGMGMGHPGWTQGILGQTWSTQVGTGDTGVELSLLVGTENTGSGIREPTGNHGMGLGHLGWAVGTLGGDRMARGQGVGCVAGSLQQAG